MSPTLLALAGVIAATVPAPRIEVAPRLRPLLLAPRVSRVTPAQVQTPRLLRPGTMVKIEGNGFKAGARVRFGNDDAVVNAAAVDAGGAWVTARVPAQATSGAVSILQDGKIFASPQPIAVDNWRNVHGYSFGNTRKFQNMVGGWSFKDLTDVFGFDQTHLNVFGWHPEDPLAWAFLKIANASLDTGQCFGFTVSSLRFQAGQKQLGQFASWNGSNPSVSGPTRDIWHLKGPPLGEGQNVQPALSRYVHLNHIQQFSAEFLASWLAHWNITGNRDKFRNQVRSAIAGGRGGILTINGGGRNHVMQVFSIEEHADKSFDVLVYDPNVPFLAGEANGSRTRASTIRVDKNGHYKFDDNSGSVEHLRAMPFSAAPLHPHIPTIQGAIEAVSHLFGDAAHVTQVTDAAGKTLLAADGSPNRDPATRLNGAPFLPFDSAPGARPIYLLQGKSPYKHTIAGKAAGTYALQFVGAGFAAHVENVPSLPGHHDELVIDHAGAGAHFRTSAPAKQVRLHLSARAADKSVRTAILTADSSANEAVHLAFDAQRAKVHYRHSGRPAWLRLELHAHAPGQRLQKFVAAPAQIEHGDEVTIHPEWHALDRGGAMHLKKRDGRLLPHPIR